MFKRHKKIDTEKLELQKLKNKVLLYQTLHPGFDRRLQQCYLCIHHFGDCPPDVPRYEGYCIEWVKYVP